MNILRNIYNVSVREVRIILKHPVYLICMVAFPIFVTVFFTTLLGDGQPLELPVGVVDNDNTSTTRKLTRMLDSFQSSKVVAHYQNVDEARHAIQRGEIYAFMYFPRHTTDDLLASRQPRISFYYSSASLTAGTLTFKDLKTMSTLAGAGVGQATMQAKGFTPAQIQAALQPITLDSHMIGNPWVNYNIYLSTMIVPGCLLLFIFLLTPYSLGTELKFGTAKDLIKAAGNSTFCAIIGKMIPQTIVFLSVMYAIMVYLFGVLHFPAPGGACRLALIGALSVVASQGFGIFIFSLVPSLRMSMSICSLWGVLSFSMVGTAFPIFSMDTPLQALSWFFPLRHYFLFYQLCIFNSFPVSDALINIVALIAFIILPWFFVRRIGKVIRTYDYIP